MTAPSYVEMIVTAGDIAIVIALIYGLNQALVRAAWPVKARARAVRNASVILIAWYGAAFTLSRLDFFRGAEDRIPTIQLGVFVPIVIGAVALWRSAALSRIIDAVPQSWLVGVQLYRAMGLVFLTLFWLGDLPGAFALPAGFGDVLVGVLAPFVAFLCARGYAASGALVRIWNVLGLLDLAVAVTTGFLTSPSPAQLLSLDAPNVLINAFPLAMIPVFVVPAAVLLHLASLIKLSRAHGRQDTQAYVGAAAH
jgi:hypothetical protein